MSAVDHARRTILFVNIAHAFDHFTLLIFPTAVIAIALEVSSSYAELIELATGAFVAFGLFSLPVGWIADKVGRRNLLGIFFFGVGLTCLALSQATESLEFMIGLFVLGMFGAIYHPVGSAMLVSNATKLGRDLGVNGVWGNMGAALASGVTGLLAMNYGWQAAFYVPGILCLLAGTVFVYQIRDDGQSLNAGKKSKKPVLTVSRPIFLLGVFAIALIGGGMTFNITTIALPKIIDDGIGAGLALAVVGSLTTGVFVFGAMTQLLIGKLMDRYALPTLFVFLSLLQPVGLALAAFGTGLLSLLGLVLSMAAIYGQVVINDGMVARYIPVQFQAKAFGFRYFIGFGVAGAAVPLISNLYEVGGMIQVLITGAGFGATVFGMAVLFYALARPGAADVPNQQPAE
jgi:MFS family permease